jgi:negative regulator of sigma E activity
MSKGVNESISSLFDDELDEVERSKLIDTLKRSDEYMDVWHRYSLVSQALKRDLPNSPGNELFLRVRHAIESEPALLFPSASHVENEHGLTNVVDIARKPDVHDARKSNPMFGFAVAASFALMTVLGVQFLSPNNKDGVPAVLPIAQAPVAAQAQDLQVANHSSDAVSSEEPLYAEQSVINDGQWTRITHIGNIVLNGKPIERPVEEAHVNLNVKSQPIPFTQPVNVNIGNEAQ